MKLAALFPRIQFGFALALGAMSAQGQAPASVGASGPGEQQVVALPPYYPGLVEGMIRIDDKAYLLSASVWPSKFVPVCWEASVPVGPERGWVIDAIQKSWEANSGLVFVVATTACAQTAKGVRVAVRDDGANDGPHTVNLGRFLDGIPSGMVLNFTFLTWGPSCRNSEAAREQCIRSIAVHEFGHAIGFAHEQNRPDTPGECAIQKQGPNGNDITLTPWDARSVMNYCNPVYNNNGVLSDLDAEAVAKVYPRHS